MSQPESAGGAEGLPPGRQLGSVPSLQKIAEGMGEDADSVEVSRIRELVRAIHEEHSEEGFSVEMDPSQVGQFLTNMDKSDGREHLRGMTLIVGGLLFAAFFLGFIGFLTWLLLHYQKPDFIVPLITHIVTAVFAFLGGWGFSYAKNSMAE